MPTATKLLYNKFNAPGKIKVPAGSAIYKYKYMDKKTGEINEKEINIQEKIQSYLSQVDYKKRIELGLGLEAPLLDNGNVSDFTGLPDNTVDLINLTNALASLSPEQVAYILQQNAQTSQTTNPSGQTAPEDTQTTGTVTPTGVSSTQSPVDTGTTTGGL